MVLPWLSSRAVNTRDRGRQEERAVSKITYFGAESKANNTSNCTLCSGHKLKDAHRVSNHSPLCPSVLCIRNAFVSSISPTTKQIMWFTVVSTINKSHSYHCPCNLES